MNVPMRDPLAYFLTWTTYGTHLPGDERGWADRGHGIQTPNDAREEAARSLLAHDPVVLSNEEREIVDATIRAHCEVRSWALHAVNVRTNHVHVVVTAKIDPDETAEQFKAWCTRRLNGVRKPAPKHWWTRGQSTPYVNTEDELSCAVDYVLNRQ